jgi:hypothetical protein
LPGRKAIHLVAWSCGREDVIDKSDGDVTWTGDTPAEEHQ